MIGLRSLAAFGFASVALFTAACSSSSGGSKTTFACATSESESPTNNSTCISCIQSKCGSQASAAYGSDYASGDITGGACGSFISCIAKCACNDVACATNCLPMEMQDPCMSAESTFNSCESSNCASECDSTTGSSSGTSSSSGSSSGTTSSSGGSSSGTSSGSSSGTASGSACDMSAQNNICLEGIPAADCTSGGGTAVSSCPAANLTGCCSVAGTETCYYGATLSAADIMMACTSESGTFKTSP